MTPTKKNILYMIKESNAIEGVYDKASISCARRSFEYMLKYDGMHPTIIKHAHKILMKNQDLEDKYKGRWRDIPVYIGGVKKDLPPLIIEEHIKELCHQINRYKDLTKRQYDPVELHVRFEDIHPFVDGNGRMGRMILNWHLVKMGFDLKIYTEEDKQDYYKLFQRRDYGHDFFTS